jgi:hypothetical protein
MISQPTSDLPYPWKPYLRGWVLARSVPRCESNPMPICSRFSNLEVSQGTFLLDGLKFLSLPLFWSMILEHAPI